MKSILLFLSLIGFSAVFGVHAAEPAQIDVSDGFGNAKWGMSYDEILKLSPKMEEDTTDRPVKNIHYTGILVQRDPGPVSATYFLFWQDQLIAVVRLFDPEILEQTTIPALRSEMAKRFSRIDGVELSFENESIWNQPRRKPSFLPSGKPIVEDREVAHRLRLIIWNKQLHSDISARMLGEKREKYEAAAEKLVPGLISP